MVDLYIMRHGQSTANRDNIFTGWSDVALTTQGVAQAKVAGQKLAAANVHFTQVHTSYLRRAIQTTNIVLEELNQLYLPLHKSWRLNERHYGALRGMNKDEAKAEFGAWQVHQWRRSYVAVPPLLPTTEAKRQYPLGLEPRGESLAMASARLLPYWQDVIAPELRQGHNQLIVAHGSTLRALIKYLEQIDDADIMQVEVDNGSPIHYQLDDQLKILKKEFV